MNVWLSANEHLRIKHGAKRADGKVFCGYGVGYRNGEHWAGQSLLDANRKLCRDRVREMRKDDNYKKAYATYCRTRYDERPDVRRKTADRVKAWANKFPERRAGHAAKRRAIKAIQLHPAHDEAIEQKMHAEAKAFSVTTGVQHEVDHIIPIKRGGWHHHLNLQVLPISVNRKKQANPFWISDTHKDFRSVPQELWPEALVDFYLAMLSV